MDLVNPQQYTRWLDREKVALHELRIHPCGNEAARILPELRLGQAGVRRVHGRQQFDPHAI